MAAKHDQLHHDVPDGHHLVPGDGSEDMEMIDRPAVKRSFSGPSHSQFTGLHTQWGELTAMILYF